MEMSLVATLFPGIASLFVQDPVIACARIFMIIFGFIPVSYTHLTLPTN